MLFIGLLQVTVPYALMFAGQTMVPSSLAAVLFCTFPIWLVLLGRWLVPGERLTGRKPWPWRWSGWPAWWCCRPAPGRPTPAAGGSGWGRCSSPPGPSPAPWPTRWCGGAGGPPTPVVMTFVQTLGASVALPWRRWRWRAALPGAWTARALGAIGYLAVGGTVLTYLGLYWLLPRISLVAVGTIPLVDTTVALTLGTLVAGERLTAAMLAGAALVLAATALSISRPAGPGGMARAARLR